MANFKIMMGMWVRCVKDIGELQVGLEYQILSIERLTGHISFVGVKGLYKPKHVGQYIEPVGSGVASQEVI